MPSSTVRTYSRHSQQAVQLLGALIRSARKERKMTAAELALRAGISRGLLQRIEKGDMKCEIGAAFEVATIVGVSLFDVSEQSLSRHLRQVEEKLSLLPKSIRKPARVIDDDF